MKQNLLKSLAVLFCLVTLGTKAQTYSAWGLAINETGHMYDTISNYGDSLKFNFVNTQAIAYGTPKLIVYYQGAFDEDNMDVFDESLNYISSTNYGNYCNTEDSTVITLTPAQINLWTANNSILFTIVTNAGANCAINRVRAKLVYDYCLSGAPSQLAMPAISNSVICSMDSPYTLTGTPAGGTFSGQGVTGTTFNPAGLSPGSYVINYTATDSQTCTSTGSLVVYIRPMPTVASTMIACYNSTTSIAANYFGGSNNIIWYSDAVLTNSLSASGVYTTPNLTQTTTYYVAAIDHNYSLSTSTLTANNFAIVDENNLAGDDRGGIAVTHNYVYLNGDNHAVRYDLALTPSTGISLPIRDGIFSDLNTGKLWTLWSTTLNSDPNNSNNSFYTVDALRGLDSNLALTNDIIMLSQPVNMGDDNNQSGIFAGAGAVGLYDGNSGNWYVVDIGNGEVSAIGSLNNPDFYESENWAVWGILESNCGGSYSVLYRDDNDDNIDRLVLPNGAVTIVGTFTDLSDMASLTFNPWNNRWYWHYEGGGSVFGGNQETLGYADATGIVSQCSGSGLSCPAKVTVNVPAHITFSTSPVGIICLSDDLVALSGGSPSGGNYSGVGVGTSTSGTVFYPALAGIGTFSINYTYTDPASGCTDMAARQVTVDACTGIKTQSSVSGISIFPNPSNGTFYFTTNTEVAALSIEVSDTQGRVVFTSQENGLASGSTKQLDLNSLNNGMYLVKMSNGANTHVQRIIITH